MHSFRRLPVLAEPDRTPYDLNFRLFGFRVRIHPLFWLATVILGMNALDSPDGKGVLYLLIWVAVVFVSILVHEFGHALAYRTYGSNARVVLWMFGGLALGTPDVAGRWRRIFVSLAGPIAGFILFGIVYGSHLLTGWGSIEHGPLVRTLYFQLVFINLTWGIVNLFPVYPLDGGQVSRELCEGKWPGRGARISLQISLGFAAAIAVYSLACELDARAKGLLLDVIPYWARGTFYTALLFGMLAYSSYQLLQFHRGRGYYSEGIDDRLPWEK
jgi:stage IV sporulation protein FB